MSPVVRSDHILSSHDTKSSGAGMGNATSWIAQSLCPEEQVVWMAAKKGDLDTLQRALTQLTPENRVYLEWKDRTYGYTPLATACVEGHEQCVIALLAVGVDVNARDVKGQTPLHLATITGKHEVVRLLLQHPTIDVHARTVVKGRSALDLARYEMNQAFDGGQRHVLCIELIEKKLCVYSGWLYQRVDNLLSLASGISSLNSWRKRYCMILRTADPDVVEIDLFNMKPGDKRPPCPDTEIVYKLTAGIDHSPDGTWFNRREHRFSLSGYTKAGINRVSAPQLFDFAALSQADLVSWKTFFSSMRLSAGTADATSTYTAAASAPVPTANSMLEEQRQLERALQLSLQESRQHAVATQIPPAPPAPSLAFASAPSWNEEMPSSPQATIAPDGVEIVQPLQIGVNVSAAVESTVATSAPPASSIQDRRVPEDPPANATRNECIICFDGPQSAVCVPCGHNAVCMDCAHQLLRSTRQCPVCRGAVREVIKIYRV